LRRIAKKILDHLGIVGDAVLAVEKVVILVEVLREPTSLQEI